MTKICNQFSMKIKVLNLSRSFQTLSNYACLLIVFNLLDKADVAFGWGRSGNSDSSSTLSKYGMNFNRGWLSDSSSVAIEIDGCVWGTVADREDMLCMEDESEDGTTMWYQMANCRRAQVAYSVYSTSSGKTSCSRNDWKESVRKTIVFLIRTSLCHVLSCSCNFNISLAYPPLYTVKILNRSLTLDMKDGDQIWRG